MIQSIDSAFRAIIFAALLFLSGCAQQAKMPEVDYALVWSVLEKFV